jgi:hypothetical protein
MAAIEAIGVEEPHQVLGVSFGDLFDVGRHPAGEGSGPVSVITHWV